MQTYSHFIITAVLSRTWQKRLIQNGPLQVAGLVLPPLKKKTLLFGSILPDLLLTMLGIGAIGYDLIRGVEFRPGVESVDSATSWLFNHAFFNVWGVQAAQNLFHGPLLLVCYIGVGYITWRRGHHWGAYLFWLAVASLIHTAIDIPLHYDDGPLLLFPFNTTTRFHSPISYWDPARHGRLMAALEHGLILGLLIFLVWDWWRVRAKKSSQ